MQSHPTGRDLPDRDTTRAIDVGSRAANPGNPEPPRSGPRDHRAHQHPAHTTDHPAKPGAEHDDESSLAPAAEAPRPTWVHTAPTPEELLAQAERAVGDRYRIESLAGEGGMGRVFSARDTRLGRRVAIKLLTVLDPHPGEDPGLRAHNRLVSEARAMAHLNHPGLCRVIEVSLVGQTPFLVMDWADGVPFDTHCRKLDVRRRLTVLLQVLDAVAEMHHEGLVHGDLKPSNIIIGRDGSATIVDFGLARAESDPSWIAIPKGGTPGYAAPEVMTASERVGPEADVFAAGVMLYEILTGTQPFDRRTSPAVYLELINRGSVRLPEEHAPETPADLQKICLAAIEADPQLRYPDAAAMASDIRRYLRRETVAARPRILESRFDEQIESQIAQAAEWRRLGLITQREGETITRTLADLRDAESPWIIDARRLRASQVSLYLGGWILLLGLVVGLNQIWTLVPPPASLAIAWLISAAVLALGLRLQRSGEKRVGIGMLVTGQATLTAAAWLTLRETGLLAGAAGAGMGPARELTQALGLSAGTLPAPGLANAQLLAVSAFGLTIAAGLRSIVRSSAFTFFIVVLAAAAWLSVFLVLGGLDTHPDAALARWGAWFALLGVTAIPVGLAIDRREHGLIRRLGRRRANRRDAAPVLGGAVTAAVLGINTVAWFAPAWYTGSPVGLGPPETADRAYAFFINGIVAAALLIVLGRDLTPLRRRIAEVFRWLVPSHLMLPLLFMEIAETWGVWAPWLAALPLLALGFCFGSALRQWKPFLISGLAYLAVWYTRGFHRIETELAGLDTWRLALTAAFLAMGPALIFIAWRSPVWIANRRLRRWTLEHPLRRPARSRSWR